MSLINIEVPTDTIVCDNVDCRNPKHMCDLYVMYNEIVNCLNNANRPFCPKILGLVGMNMYLNCIWTLEMHLETRV